MWTDWKAVIENAAFEERRGENCNPSVNSPHIYINQGSTAALNIEIHIHF